MDTPPPRKAGMRSRDRSRALDDLAVILAKTIQLDDLFWTAAAVQQRSRSKWTDEQLAALRTAAEALRDAVLDSPLTGD